MIDKVRIPVPELIAALKKLPDADRDHRDVIAMRVVPKVSLSLVHGGGVTAKNFVVKDFFAHKEQRYDPDGPRFEWVLYL